MKFNDLLEGIKEYHKKNAKFKSQGIYDISVSPNHIKWQNIQDHDVKKIFDFLNKWGRCRSKCKQDEFLKGYHNAYPLLKPFANLRLENFNDFELLLDVESEHMKVKRTIHIAFDELANTTDFGPVPTSKLLHLFAPSFFVMWDKAICRRYGLHLNGYNYANMFLPKMKLEIREAIEDYMNANGTGKEKAINSIYDETEKLYGHPRSWAKSVDEFNWIRSHSDSAENS